MISIHALLAESDWGLAGYMGQRRYFYPRSPCGERRCSRCLLIQQQGFLSTLSLRRATRGNYNSNRAANNFYPRSPCGERHLLWQTMQRSTQISIHALLAESDSTLAHETSSTTNFYPRSPCGERLHSHFFSRRWILPISIHALLAESDILPDGSAA